MLSAVNVATSQAVTASKSPESVPAGATFEPVEKSLLLSLPSTEYSNGVNWSALDL